MEYKMKKNAVDLTDLAIGIVVLGIVVTIGASVLINVRDTSLTDSTLQTTTDTQVTPLFGGADRPIGNAEWYAATTSVENATGGETVLAGNYTVTIDTFGGATFGIDTAQYNNTLLNVTYTSYDTSGNPAYSLADNAAIGIAEYGNWFDIIVIVGVAGLILSLIFMAFGRRDGGEGSLAY